MKVVHAEWIEYMKAYRLYNPYKPQQTIAYEDDWDEMEQRAEEEGYKLALCDADTMHVEEYI